MDVTLTLNDALAGRYEIEKEIGRGGMATVYLARDIKHDRPVALKVLDPELGAVLGVERFLSEIRVTANLQHPNLLPLFDSGSANGLLFYVMPFIQGETLRDKLLREKQLSIEEATRIATAVANGLDYAHRQGVVHRDLKPENILLHDGQPLVADFGIALAVSNAGGTRVTQTGLSLGTPQYMSPEQATGDRGIDGRTDIYSLGAIAYEMLAGEPPHTGGSAQAVIARLMTEEPRSLSTVRKSVPGNVVAAVSRALEKLPADRFASAKEFAVALSTPLDPALEARTPATGARAKVSARATLTRAIPWAIAALALVGWLTTRRAPSTTASPTMRFTMELPDSARLREEIGTSLLTISTAGNRVAWVGGGDPTRLYSRRVDQLNAEPIAGTVGARSPRFSPDDRWILMNIGGDLVKVPAEGGAPSVVVRGATYGVWHGDDNVLYYGGRQLPGLWKISAAGGTGERLTVPDTTLGESQHRSPEMVPGTDVALFVITYRANIDSNQLAAIRLSDRKITRLGVHGVGRPRYDPRGYAMVTRDDGSISAFPFDPTGMKITGPEGRLPDRTLVKTGGASELAVSHNGVIAIVRGRDQVHLAAVKRDGTWRTIADSMDRFRSVRVSPDGMRILMITGVPQRVVVYSTTSRSFRQVAAVNRMGGAEWSVDGSRIVWTSTDDAGTGTTIESETIDGRDHRTLGRVSGVVGSFALAPDARTWAFGKNAGYMTPAGSVVVGLIGASDSSRVAGRIESSPRISPDGRWLAYVSAARTGRNEVYVRKLEGGQDDFAVSSGGGVEPVFGRDGRTIYHRGGGRIVATTYSASGDRFMVGRVDSLFQAAAFLSLAIGAFDVTPDGELVMLRQEPEKWRIMVVSDWLPEVKERYWSAKR